MPHKHSEWIRFHVRMAIYARDHFDCAWCRLVFPPPELGRGLSLDHVDPRGGNAPENLVTACRRCNSQKRDLPLADWLALLGHLLCVDPREVDARVRAQLALPLDVAEGLRLAKLRRPRYPVQGRASMDRRGRWAKARAMLDLGLPEGWNRYDVSEGD